MKTQQECKTGHTPTPWTADIINNWPESEEKANQEFMLRAVNSHDALIDALKICLDQISYASRYKFGSDVKTLRDTLNNVTNILTDALKLDEDK